MGAVSKQLRDARGGTANHLQLVDKDIPTNQMPPEYFFRLVNNGDAPVFFSLMKNTEQLNYDDIQAGVIFDETDTFKCEVQHPKGIVGARDAIKEAHILAAAFSYDVEDDSHTDQFGSKMWFATIKDGVTQVPKDLRPAITNGRTGNTQTKYIRIVEASIALTRCSDVIIEVKAGRTAVITPLVAAITRATK